ncbi:MAG: phosphoglucosamine mutase [Candidatus Altiarchaeota archaeon]|nr:phosphoglucosamine mutase [Candidatus Altiarchaeota archaeon]
MNPKLFGTSGIRRKVDELTPEFVRNLSMAVGTFSQDKDIAVGMDTRKSSPRLKGELISGLTSCGHGVVDLGIVPTPTLALASQEYGTGVMITASHNPPDWNGFKLCSAGMALSPEKEAEIEKIFHSGGFREGPPGDIKENNYIEKHTDLILKSVGTLPRLVKVLLDCANGSGSTLTPQLLEKMGCEVIAINTEKSGEFPHGLEPTAENLKDVCSEVKNSGAEIGIAHDGDADRSAAIGKNGELIEWDSLLAVLASGKDKVVTTVDASMRIDAVAKEVIRTPIGDVVVASAVKRENADFGGEPSGSFIFPEVHLFPDGPLTAAKIVSLVSRGEFYETLSSIKSYPMKRLKIPCEESSKQGIMEKLKSTIKDADYTDGVKINKENGWFLIRPSGTEPYMRITAEGENQIALDDLVIEASELLEPLII